MTLNDNIRIDILASENGVRYLCLIIESEGISLTFSEEGALALVKHLQELVPLLSINSTKLN